MKAESNIRPPKYNVDKTDKLAIVTFYENVIEKQNEEGTVFEYDSYELPILIEQSKLIEQNYKELLSLAKNQSINYKKPSIEERVVTLEQDQEQVIDLLAQALGV